MNKREAAILSAFTGIMIGSFSDMHEYVEEKLGRPVFTSEFGSEKFAAQLKEAVRGDFIKLNEDITD